MKRFFLVLALALSTVLGRAQTSPTVRVDSLAALVALPIPTINNHFSAIVAGNAVAGDSFQAGLFVYIASSSVTTNGFSVFKPTSTTGRWHRVSGANYNQKDSAIPADSTTYAFSVLKDNANYVFGVGSDNTYTYAQSWSGQPLKINASGNNTLLNPSSGKVGIGTDAPTSRLHVVRADDDTLTRFVSTFPNSVNSGQSISIEASNNNTDPAYGLNRAPGISIQNTDGTANTYGMMLFVDAGGNGVAGVAGLFQSDANNQGSLLFSTRPASGSLAERARISSTGNLLVGGTSETGLSGSGGIRAFATTAATSSTTGSLIVGNGSTSTTVGIGGGNIYAGGSASITGNVGIGTTADSRFGLYVNTSGLTLGGVHYGIIASPNFQDNTTVLGASSVVEFETASSVTMTSGYGLLINSPSIGAANNITTLKGISVPNMGATGVANAYGIDIAAQSGAATTNIGLRNAGQTVLTLTTAATSSTSGALIIGDGSASTTVGIGGGVIKAGSTISPSASSVTWSAGAGSPEGSVTAVVGSIYSRTDGGAGTSFYVKESGSGNTGWAAK